MKTHKIISNGSCTTNCLAPIAYLMDNNIGIESGYMTTVHSVTGDQNTIDTLHKDLGEQEIRLFPLFQPLLELLEQLEKSFQI